jgi:hypothetical protein
MMAYGITIRHRVRAPTFTLMELTIMACGNKIYSMATERRNGRMDLNSKESTEMVRKTEWGNIPGLMGLSTRESGKTMRLQVTAITSGLTEGDMWVIGKAISWMLLVFTLGKMAECTKASTRKTKSMDMVFTHGQTRRSMLAGGATVNSMALEFLYQKKAERS